MHSNVEQSSQSEDVLLAYFRDWPWDEIAPTVQTVWPLRVSELALPYSCHCVG